jgi:hypothetical protein
MEYRDAELRLGKLEERVEKLERLIANKANELVAKERRLSAKEFMLSKKLNSEVQKVLALAYFLEREESMVSFNVADLETAFRSAREKLPSNMNDAVNKNIAKGLVMQAAEKKDSKKAWQLTSTGERYVEHDLN